MAMGKDDVEEKDCAHYNTVTELFGFLNLSRGPIYNEAARESYESYRRPEDAGAFMQVLRVGKETRAALETKPSLVAELNALLDRMMAIEDDDAIIMEGIRLANVAKKYPDAVADQADGKLRADTQREFRAHLAAAGPLESALAVLHILLDAVLYVADDPAEARERGSSVPSPAATVTRPAPSAKSDKRLRLPDALRPVAEEAMALLRAGFHVLLAGAPGTGKTTAAQIVAHAWNHRVDGALPSEIDLALAPRTVVAHSAWATFHTVGGLLPDEKGNYRVAPGVFVEASSDPGVWQLRPECFVLDEMNRADLDRCIGDLYPILSHSVGEVVPAGLPGVRAIRDDAHFRIVATVNDATLDDVVFPISEGLARRFVRLELPGASMQHIAEFLAVDDAIPERVDAAKSGVQHLFESTREHAPDKLSRVETRDHLPFGAGYFAPLQLWARGKLKLSTEPDPLHEARRAICLSLRSMARVRGFDKVLAALEEA